MLINLKDYSVLTITNTKLYKKVQEINSISLSTSICEVVGEQKDEPILEISKGKNENEVTITTFGYVGRFSLYGEDFNIGYRFGNVLLDKMIGKVNDFEVKSLELEATQSKKKSANHDSLALKILYMNFIFKLEKISVIGLPKTYIRVEYHDTKFKGQIDINRFIKKDVPYQGKISSNSYEQFYVQEIVDVLYGALSIVERDMQDFVSNRVFQLRNLLKHYASRVFVDNKTIDDAISHKSIQNSLYSDFKEILEVASYIINHNPNLKYLKNKLSKGLIFDVSLLWEKYLYKLLSERFDNDDWKVIHEDKCDVYETMFFKRGMKPDIVIKNEIDKKILVFDAKSKSMTLTNGIGDGGYGDLDRSDFFQINTYMTYYEKKNYKVISGGLLYPIEAEFDCRFDDKIDYAKAKAHSDNWFGDNKTKFIVDGIDLSYIENKIEDNMTEDEKQKIRMDNIINAENNFIDRIQKISENAE